MVHEATHQLGYNLGLHNRTGSNPKWIVEGLATVFETPGMETHASDRSAMKRVNAGWLRAFNDSQTRIARSLFWSRISATTRRSALK